MDGFFVLLAEPELFECCWHDGELYVRARADISEFHFDDFLVVSSQGSDLRLAQAL
jgi:hypothetical protein